MFNLDDDIMRQLRATFKIEAAEHIQAMNRVLLALEQNPEEQERAALLAEIFREAHSLKGAAGAADFPDVEKTAHKLESVFGAAKTGKLQLTRDLCDVLYAGIDSVGEIVEASLAEKDHGLDLPALYARLDAAECGQVIRDAPAAPVMPAPVIAPLSPVPSNGASAPTPQAVVAPLPAPAEQPFESRAIAEPRNKPAPEKERRKAGVHGAPANEDTIRVATGKLDSLMARSGELLVAGLKIDQRLREIEETGHALEELNREWLKARAANSALLHDGNEQIKPLIRLMDVYQEKLRALSIQVGDLKRGFSGDALHLARVTNDLGEGVMKVRMLPVATVFDAFPRMVRDLARDMGKEVELRVEGAETELDRKVLEEIKDPVMHLIRNAVDHGIEKPDERARVGKPTQGVVNLRAFQKGNNIVIQVADDGAGINRDRVKQSALKHAVITPEQAQVLSDDEALMLIFASGLSTSPIITGVSGRGVGMDVVRRNVEALQGQVDVHTALGKGTTFDLTLPLTLATTQELLVQVADQTFGIPISAVERILRISKKDIAAVSGRRAVVVDDEPVSLVPLAQVLELQNDEQQVSTDGKMPIVILGSGRKRVAFLVDAVVGQQESVVKSLGKQLARVRNVAGATILGSGKVVMTLNPMDLVKSIRGAQNHAVAAPAKTKKTKQAAILVVDDSLSTRTLEKNILETAGYKVTVATDGVEALSVLSSNGGYDLVVSDVLMPRMDGLQLTASIKKDPNLKKIPVVLVTSLDSQKDRESGLEVGADAYLVKSNFDQSNLLDTVAQLI
ncbi:MAG: hybrid sensor histidine kinase/response regulator [Chloroflexi bacterium]|nr:hybrid sensor histidine kinase/response regulator [Chloroflexota bacterium]